MDIMCIDNSCAIFGTHPYLKFGETYEAIGEELNEDKQECYIIPELPVSQTNSGILNDGPLYRKIRFIKLDEPAEVIEEQQPDYATA